ncbi:MAG: hypothetical protein FIB08_16410 [Candidatus Methanoperedens sp.]|nr:hypothetical protein [Candidatus Methanoperedens sp.]
MVRYGVSCNSLLRPRTATHPKSAIRPAMHSQTARGTVHFPTEKNPSIVARINQRKEKRMQVLILLKA